MADSDAPHSQMKSSKHWMALILAVLLAACLFAYYSTRDSAALPAHQKSAATPDQLVDTSLLQTALKLTPLAATLDEQGQAREAWRLADRELDLSFAAALRDAQAEAEAASAGSGPSRQLNDRITTLKNQVEADKQRVKDLTSKAGAALDLAQAQLDLDQDELDNSQQDLASKDGGKQAKLQRLVQEHEASDKVADQALKFGAPGPTGTMSEQLREWFSLGGYIRQLEAAAEQADAHDRTLLDQYNALQRQLPSQPDAQASVGRLRQLSGQHKTLSGLDQRVQQTKQLVPVYRQWSAMVENRQRAVQHLILRSLALILGILLAGVLLNGAIPYAFRQTERRRLHQLRVIARITLQVVATLLILLIIFGVPTQISTMIGLVTAGLTVALKDFIVSFFGWFMLMGKNGVSVGDWVEIEGVSGEVIEIGLLKTVLLELGNWTATGHPTGRRVAFPNSYALEGHYFNFSTSRQWLWDELQLTLPREGDPYETVKQIRDIVERETQADAAEAAKDWQSVTVKYGAREFSAAPAVSLRPAVEGLEVVVRYITHAPQRNTVKSKLFQAIVDLLRQPKAPVPPS